MFFLLYVYELVKTSTITIGLVNRVSAGLTIMDNWILPANRAIVFLLFPNIYTIFAKRMRAVEGHGFDEKFSTYTAL